MNINKHATSRAKPDGSTTEARSTRQKLGSGMRIDPNNTWRLVEQRFLAEEDPVVKKNLGLVLEHMQAEARGDIEVVVATLCDNPKYVTYSSLDDEVLNPNTDKDAIRAFYHRTIVATGAHQLELDCDRVVADHHSVVTEGNYQQAYPGAVLQAMGVEIDDPDAHYAYQTRMSIVWPVDAESGMLRGEEVYTSGIGFTDIGKRKITEIVPLQ